MPNELFNKIFKDEVDEPRQEVPSFVESFDETSEVIIRDAIADIAKNYRNIPCTGRLRQMSYALWKATGFQQPFGNCLLWYVTCSMPQDASGATRELRRWLKDRNPANWRKEHAKKG